MPEPEDGGQNPQPPGENHVIRGMRQEIEASKDAERQAKAEAAEFKAKLESIEREKLDEVERLRLEKQDLETKAREAEALRDQNGRFASKFQTLYESALASVPEEHREAVADLSASGNWDDRYDALQKAMKLVNVKPEPVKAGTVTQPGAAGPVASVPNKGEPVDLKNIGNMTFGFRDKAAKQYAAMSGGDQQ